MTHVAPDCRIYLVVEAGPAAIAGLTAAADVADIACCLIVPAAVPLTAAAARPIVEAAQRAGVRSVDCE